MYKRIIFAGILLCLFIAIPLSLMGIKQVELGDPFLAFMKALSKDLETYKVAIPDIPHIPSTNQFEGAWLILDVVIKFFNFIIDILNFFLMFINIIIQLFQCLFLIIKHLITLKDTLAEYQVTSMPIQ